VSGGYTSTDHAYAVPNSPTTVKIAATNASWDLSRENSAYIVAAYAVSSVARGR
jgi:hypothetical protein